MPVAPVEPSLPSPPRRCRRGGLLDGPASGRPAEGRAAVGLSCLRRDEKVSLVKANWRVSLDICIPEELDVLNARVYPEETKAIGIRICPSMSLLSRGENDSWRMEFTLSAGRDVQLPVQHKERCLDEKSFTFSSKELVDREVPDVPYNTYTYSRITLNLILCLDVVQQKYMTILYDIK